MLRGRSQYRVTERFLASVSPKELLPYLLAITEGDVDKETDKDAERRQKIAEAYKYVKKVELVAQRQMSEVDPTSKSILGKFEQCEKGGLFLLLMMSSYERTRRRT